jgi:hypothetical protein
VKSHPLGGWRTQNHVEPAWFCTRTPRHPSFAGSTSAARSAPPAAGDFDGDVREDVISFVQWLDEINVWGLIGPAVETAFANGQTRVFPVIIPCNVDSDALALAWTAARLRRI